MKAWTVLLALFVSGCGNVIYKEDWDTAESLCKDRGGIRYILRTDSTIRAACHDKTDVILYRDKLKHEL